MTETSAPYFVMKRNERFKKGVNIRPPCGAALVLPDPVCWKVTAALWQVVSRLFQLLLSFLITSICSASPPWTSRNKCDCWFPGPFHITISWAINALLCISVPIFDYVISQILLLINDFICPIKLNDLCHEYLLAITQSSAVKWLTKQRLQWSYWCKI